jgi:predicted N-formylglutamate amidohydrolase
MSKPVKLIITCEHASMFVPAKYKKLIPIKVLNTHRGIDFGAEEFAKKISTKYKSALHLAKATRLLVDLNRAPHNRQHLFSRPIKDLGPKESADILKNYYLPFRSAAEKEIRKALSQGFQVFHLSVHSFTPFLYGKTRETDIGILFDPVKEQERLYAKAWRANLKKQKSPFRVRFNYPYKGTSDGFTTYLRKKINSKNYIGIELEMNQKYPLKNKTHWKLLQEHLITSIPR